MQDLNLDGQPAVVPRETSPNPAQKRLSLVIPCFNEVEGIPQLCARLRPVLADLGHERELELVFVDDGSTDGTAQAIAQHAAGLPYRVVTHARNQGLGAALRTGLAAATGDEIVTLDSDCTYDPADVPALLAALRAGADVVTGSPYHPDGEVVGVAGWRLTLSRTLSRFYWLLVPQHLYTYTSCFRAYRRGSIRDLETLDDGFLAVTQLLVRSILRGERVVEWPATLTTRRFGQSKIRVVQVSLSHLRYLVRVAWMRLRGTDRLGARGHAQSPSK